MRPAGGSFSAPVRLSATGQDASWVFGDGNSTTGTAPTHTYTTPGTFAVSVSAADSLANTTGATRAITTRQPRPQARPPPPSGHPIGSTRTGTTKRAFFRIVR